MKTIVPTEVIEQKILLIRGHKVMIDRDLAKLYGVTTSNLNKAVGRNIESFPEDFMFQLTKEEEIALRFQIGTLKRGQHSKYLPRVFTEQGVAMLSSVLKSKRARQVNIAIMRTFVKLRELMSTHKDLKRKIEDMEKKYDYQFQAVFDAIKKLLEPAHELPKRKIGFHP